MRNHILITLVFLPFFAGAQDVRLTVGLQSINQKGNTIGFYDPGSFGGNIYSSNEIEENNGGLTGGVLIYHPYLAKTGVASLGAQAGFEIYASYKSANPLKNQYGVHVGTTGGYPLVMGYNLPLLVMARLGNGSTETTRSMAPVGVAFGAGVMAIGFNTPLDKGFMVPFSIAAEASYKNFGLRFDLPLSKYKSVYKSTTGDIPRITSSFYSVKLTISLSNY